MKDIQEVFDRIKDAQKEQRELKKVIKSAKENSASFQKVNEDLTAAKHKKKDIEEKIENDLSSECIKLDRLKDDIKTDKELLSDISISKLMKGETVEVKDQYDNDYEPIFSVRFKKTS